MNPDPVVRPFIDPDPQHPKPGLGVLDPGLPIPLFEYNNEASKDLDMHRTGSDNDCDPGRSRGPTRRRHAELLFIMASHSPRCTEPFNHLFDPERR